jgi:hypothetical protein
LVNNNISRRRLVSKTQFRYVRVVTGNDDVDSRCFYCGELATTKDHIYPVAAMSYYVDANVPKKSHIVPSCRECNLIASSNTFRDAEEKCAYIKSKLLSRYAKLLKVPIWDSGEIEQLDGRLRDYVEELQARRRIVAERIAHTPNYELLG